MEVNLNLDYTLTPQEEEIISILLKEEHEEDTPENVENYLLGIFEHYLMQDTNAKKMGIDNISGLFKQYIANEYYGNELQYKYKKDLE